MQMIKQDYTSTESGAAMCDAHFKQKDHLSFICMCIIINLHLLETSDCLRISLVETAG